MIDREGWGEGTGKREGRFGARGGLGGCSHLAPTKLWSPLEHSGVGSVGGAAPNKHILEKQLMAV